MGDALKGIAGAGLGAVGGLFANQKEGGTTAGNAFIPTRAGDMDRMRNTSIDAILNAGNTTEGYLDPGQAQQLATQQIQGNGILGGMFGQGGTLDQTEQDVNQLQNQGYQLTPEDRTAYGQASGDIARQFDQSDSNLANQLAQRGLSSSGVSGQMFANSMGNKNEQLQKAQQQIAQNRMNTTMQRLGQARSFLGQLGALGNNALQGQQGMNLAQQGQLFGQQMQKGQAAQQYLGNIQGQQNNSLQQEQQTAHSGTLGNVFNGAVAGLAAGGGSGGGSSSMF